LPVRKSDTPTPVRSKPKRAMAKRAGATVVEVKGSHAVYVSQPSAVAALIEQAARKVKAATA
jgi:hypothetical protein